MDRKIPNIITIASIKGGVGKSTTALIIAKILSEKNKVLLIDTDTQASTTSYFTEKLEEKNVDIVKINIYEVLKENIDINKSIIHVDNNISLLPSYLSLHVFNNESIPFKETRLQDCIKMIINKFDYIIIDSNPSMDFTLINSLVVSDYIIIPIIAEKWAIESLDLFKFFMDKLKLKTPTFLLNTRFKKNNSHKILLDILNKESNFLGSISEREDLNRKIAENSSFDFNKDYIKEYKRALEKFFRLTEKRR